MTLLDSTIGRPPTTIKVGTLISKISKFFLINSLIGEFDAEHNAIDRRIYYEVTG